MKRLTLIVLLGLSSLVWSQTTTVTGTIVDPNGNAYANGTVSAYSVVPSGQASTTSGPFSLNGSGAFSIVLKSSVSYQFTVCAPPTILGPRANPTPTQVCFSSNPIAISGGSQDVSTTLNAVAVVLGPASGGGGGGGGCTANPADGGCALNGTPSIDQFVGGVGPGTAWLLQLLANGFNVKVPVNVLGTNAGSVTLGYGPDPGIGSGISLLATTSGTPYAIYFPNAPSSGYFLCSNIAGKLSCVWEAAISLTSDVTGTLTIPNGGTNATTQSGAALNILPTPIRGGDLLLYSAGWTTCPGNTGGGGSTGFLTENGTGNCGWVQTPIPVLNGGTGLQTLNPGSIYKGFGTGAMQQSAISDDATKITVTEPVKHPVTAFASLAACAAGTEGERESINDSTTNSIGAVITGGGSNHVLAYCNGTSWTVAAGVVVSTPANAPQRVALGGSVTLTNATEVTVLTETVTFPSTPGTYRADVRYGIWVTAGANACAAEVIDTTNSKAYAFSMQNANGSGYIALNGSEISNFTYAAGATPTFTVKAYCNATQTATVTSALPTGFGTTESSFLSVTPVASN